MAHIVIAPAASRIVVRWRGHVVADTTDALELREGSSPPVLYIPRAGADMKHFARTERHTNCPYKGEARYFSLTDGTARDENAVWSYETPKAGVEAIAGHLAFYPNKVEIERA
jgi:uncharacterized protein (DUF427 family)